MGVAALAQKHLFLFTVVVLAKIDVALFGIIYQPLPAAIIKFGLGGKAYFFFLNGGVHIKYFDNIIQ